MFSINISTTIQFTLKYLHTNWQPVCTWTRRRIDVCTKRSLRRLNHAKFTFDPNQKVFRNYERCTKTYLKGTKKECDGSASEPLKISRQLSDRVLVRGCRFFKVCILSKYIRLFIAHKLISDCCIRAISHTKISSFKRRLFIHCESEENIDSLRSFPFRFDDINLNFLFGMGSGCHLTCRL